MDFQQYLTELKHKPIPKEMAFTEAEFRARVQKARDYMAENGLDALLGRVDGFIQALGERIPKSANL
jgi:hypothetical protein